MAWFDEITAAIAAAAGADAATLTLSPGERRTILDCARIASHTSGERINAPLVCYALGVLAGRGIPLERAAAPVLGLDQDE